MLLPPPSVSCDHGGGQRERRPARRRVGLLVTLAMVSYMISSVALSVSAQNAPPVMPINPCQFGLPPPTGFRCENGAVVADVTSLAASSPAATATIPQTAATTAGVTNAAAPVPVATTAAATPVSQAGGPNAGPNGGGVAAVPIVPVQDGRGAVPNPPNAGFPVPGVPVPIAPAGAVPTSAGPGSAPIPGAPVPIVPAAPAPTFGSPAPPVVNSAAPVPIATNASLPPPSGAAPVPIVTSSPVVAPGSAQPSPSPTNPAAPPIINPLNPIIAPFFNSPAYTQRVQQNLPGATASPTAPPSPSPTPPPPTTRDHLNDLDIPVNGMPGIIAPGSGFLIPISNTPVTIRDDSVFGQVPLAPGNVDQQGLAVPAQNTTVRTTLLAPVQDIQGAVSIPVAMSRGARALAQVEDNEQLDLTVRELKARYLRQLRRQGAGSPMFGSLRVSRHAHQRTMQRRRTNGLQVRQGRRRNVGRVLQRLARRSNGRGAVDVRQLARRFRGNPRLRALARRIKGRRVNLGVLARWFNRRGRGRRLRRSQVGWAQRRQGGRAQGRQVGQVRRRTLSLRALAQRFPRASLDQIARRFPNNRGLRNLANRFKGRRVGIRQLANAFARRSRQDQRRRGAERGRTQSRPKGINLHGLARRFPRLNLNQIARRFPRNRGLRYLAQRLKGGRKINLQQLVQRLKQRRQRPGRKGAVQPRSGGNRRGHSNRGGLMTLFRRLHRQKDGKARANLQKLVRRFRNTPHFRGLLRKVRGNPRALQLFAERLAQRRQRRQRGRTGARRPRGLVGLQSLARRFRGNRQIQALARRFPRGRINLPQLARRFPRNRQLQHLARQLRSRQSKRNGRGGGSVGVRRQGLIGRSLINYADAWFKDIRRFNKKQQSRLRSGPMYNAHVVPVAGRASERGLGELAELAHASGWLPRSSKGNGSRRRRGRRGGRRGGRKQQTHQQQQSFFGERRARGSRMVGSADSLVRRGGDAGEAPRRAFSVGRDVAEESPELGHHGRSSMLPGGALDKERWATSGMTLQEAMKDAEETVNDDFREPKGPPPSRLGDDGDDGMFKINRRRLGGEQSTRGRSNHSTRTRRPRNRPVNVEYGNDAYQCQCDRAALRRARREHQSRTTPPAAKVFRVKLKDHPGLIPCRCVRRGSVAAVRSLRNVAKQLCPARVVPSRTFMRNLAAFSLPRVSAQAGLSLRPFGSGHPVAVLQRKASIKEDRLQTLPATRVHRFGFQSKAGIPLESRVIMARLRLRAQAKDRLSGVCTVKDAAMAVKVGGKLVASRMFPDGTFPENQVLTLIGRVPEAREALGQGRRVTIEAIVRYREKECLDMTRFEVVHTAMCLNKPRPGAKEGLEEA